ncbi:1-phosphatidylinositol 3-phosphate 5-kinase isoform X2 [Agrilus planipennis]|uniref:1-phosphatidylinositol-3-phosphate 5-kinase n=1 Tax=Agrilus planipennis TaxID=224129 RepID=A0A7F5RLI3_AGRPL|nr:1-phosphatidylinositol 3-phosphate 5-kinase isoform X2 [Agrilus planipennis]
MNKNLQSPTKLTEFAPLQPSEKNGMGNFFSRFLNFKKNNGNEDSSSNEKKSDKEQESLPSWAVDKSDDQSLSDNYYSIDINDGRSLPNVLKRISNLLVLKSSNLQAYSDTELKQYWMPDSVSKECYECSEKFTTFKRKHHCRVCGQIFCSQCCNQQIPGKIFGCTGDLRVCTYCCKVVLSYLQSPDVGAELTADLKALQESLQNKYGPLSPAPSSYCSAPANGAAAVSDSSSGTLKRKISIGYQEEKFGLDRGSVPNVCLSPEEKCRVLQHSTSLRNLYEEMCKAATGVALQSHRYRLRTYYDCFLGSALVDWLIFQQKANNRIQASALCQALLDGGYIECVSDTMSFVDGYALYRPCFTLEIDDSPNLPPVEIPIQDEPIWMQQIPQDSSATDSDNEHAVPPSTKQQGYLSSSSSYTLDLNIGANTVYLSKPAHTEKSSMSDIDENDFEKEKFISIQEETPEVQPSEQREHAPESGWHNAVHLREEHDEKLTYNILTAKYEDHEETLAKQLLASESLSLSWWDTLKLLVHEVIDVIRPDKNHNADDIDIRQYVQIKKIPGGVRNESKLIKGLVFTKNITHKKMLAKIDNPKILLLESAIVYQRTEGRLMSLEPILMQEHEYLRNIVARIVALQPNLVLVQKNVSRLAQDLLREQGVTLIMNVKQSVLERISRCTQADIVTSMDAHIGKLRVGTCKSFYIKTFLTDKGKSKTLVFMEGLPFPHLGGTILLRGSFQSELSKIKSKLSFIIFAAYNWRLEKSYLMDEFVMPPNPSNEFFEDSTENSPEPIDESEFNQGKDVLKVLRKDKELPQKKEEFSSFDNDEVFFSNKKLEKSFNENNFNNNESNKKTVESEQQSPNMNVSTFKDPLQSAKTEENLEKCGSQTLSVAELPFLNNFQTETGRKCKLRKFFPTVIYHSVLFENKKKIKFNKESEIKKQVAENEKLKPIHPFLTTKITTTVDDDKIQGLLAHFRACGGRIQPKSVTEGNEDENDQKNIKQMLRCSTQPFLDALDIVNHQKLAVLFCCFSSQSNNAPAFCVNPWVFYMTFYGINDIPLGCFLERYCFRSTYNCPSKTCDTPMVKHVRRFVHNGGCVSISLNTFENEYGEDSIITWTWCTKCQKVSPIVPLSGDTWSFSFAKYLELKFYGGIYTRRGFSGCKHSIHQDHYQYFGYKNIVASFKYKPVQLWEISLPPFLINIVYDIETKQVTMIEEVKVLASKGHEVFSFVGEKLSELPMDGENLNNLKHILMKEKSTFKQKIEEVQIKLTSPTLEKKEINFEEITKEIIAAVWTIDDSLMKIKRLIAEFTEQWNLRLETLTKKKENEKRREKTTNSNSDSPNSNDNRMLQILTNSDESAIESHSPGVTKKMKSLDQSDVANESNLLLKGHQRSQSDGTTISQNEDSYDGKKETDRKTVKNILSQFLPSSTATTLLPNPFSLHEHYSLPAGVYTPLVVYENEPSSIIAYALNSYDYKKFFEEIKARKSQSGELSPSPIVKRKSQDRDRNDVNDLTTSIEKSGGILSFLRSKESKQDLNLPSHFSNDTSGNPDEVIAFEKNYENKNNKSTHVDVQFQDSSSNFFCRVYHAEKFASLRKIVVPDGEEAYIRSLSRCVQWNARGGKSGSSFCKTKDDRFILKEIPKSEIQLFLDSAHNYFAYMHKCLSTNQPTLLGKIVGIYQIIFRNEHTNISLRTNLLVMENLFYKRSVTHRFDLKGSMRNRLVNPDDGDGEIVLLDENLLKMTCEAPLYILPHSKAVLTAAIHSDTEFLSGQSVMDYSLLVGLDSNNKELVLGIIDYIRTFTWDKKLETMVKKSGILGGQGKLPTIISPEEYRKRFIVAMHRYFLEVPDHWTGLGRGLEC